MFSFTNLDNDVELMIVAEVKELTKFRECTREFKRMIKVNHRFIEHSKYERTYRAPARGVIVGPNLSEGNVYLRMVCMGVVNRSYMRWALHRAPLYCDHLTRWEATHPLFGNIYDYSCSWVGVNGRELRCPKMEQLEFDREEKRDQWGIKSEYPAMPWILRRSDPIPSHIKGLKMYYGGGYNTCAELDIILRDLGASGYKSKRKVEKLDMWWKIIMNQTCE